MRVIQAKRIKEAVSELCIKANVELRSDVLRALKKASRAEKNRRAREVLSILVENAGIARGKRLPICQDTGIGVVYVELGQDAKVAGDPACRRGRLERAINEGVKDGYARGYLRKSVVSDPILRKNTGDNAPAVIHYEIIPGDRIKVTVMPKGFGCENASRVRMLKPTDGIKEIKDFVMEVVKDAGPDACPPYVVGVGIGGTQDKAASLAKEALILPLDKSNPNAVYAKLEKELLRDVNSLGIGPMGFGGRTSALAVKILSYPTHIAGLPVAVNLSCHALRSATKVI